MAVKGSTSELKISSISGPATHAITQIVNAIKIGQASVRACNAPSDCVINISYRRLATAPMIDAMAIATRISVKLLSFNCSFKVNIKNSIDN